jgi:hypothetical protein
MLRTTGRTDGFEAASGRVERPAVDWGTLPPEVPYRACRGMAALRRPASLPSVPRSYGPEPRTDEVSAEDAWPGRSEADNIGLELLLGAP